METTPRIRDGPGPGIDDEVEAILEAADEVPPIIEEEIGRAHV